MRVKLGIDWMGRATDEADCRMHKAGSVLSVFLRHGITLLRRHQAQWIAAEPNDQGFIPVEPFRAAVPERDKMMRGVLNKS